MADLDDIEKRLRVAEQKLAVKEALKDNTKIWAGLLGAVILIWMGVTTYVQVPSLVNQKISESAIGEAAQKINDLKVGAEKSAEIIEELRKELSLSVEVKVEDNRHPRIDSKPKVQGLTGQYFAVSTTVLDELLKTKEWKHAIVAVENLRTLRLELGFVDRDVSATQGLSTGRFDVVARNTDWKVGDFAKITILKFNTNRGAN